MVSRLRFLLAPLALLGLALPLYCQQEQQSPPSEPTAIINFILPIDPNSMNALLGTVSNQMRLGVHRVILVVATSGGDPASAFAAYNILRKMPIEVDTFNVGNVDSAGVLLFCAGKHRYSLPSPARFLIHGTMLTPMTTSVPIESKWLEAQDAQLKSLDQVIVQVVTAASPNVKQSDVEAAVHGQVILSPDDAKRWGMVEDIRETYMVPGATFVSVNAPPQASPEKSSPPEFTAGDPPAVNQ